MKRAEMLELVGEVIRDARMRAGGLGARWCLGRTALSGLGVWLRLKWF